MKKDIALIIISSILYSFLFYQEGAGVNFLIFTVLLITFQVVNNPKIIGLNTWLLAAVAGICSGVGIVLYGSALSITANIISLFTLSFTAYSIKTSFPVGLFHATYSVGSSVVFVVLDGFLPPYKQKNDKRKYRWSFTRFVFYFIIPSLAILVFFFLYRSGNIAFEQATEDIDLSFISPSWLLFLIGGSFLMYGFFRHHVIRPFQRLDENAGNTLIEKSAPTKLDQLLDQHVEKRSGVVLLILLNLLILFMNATDVVFLLGGAILPDGVNLSDSVHNGVGSIITSIVFAVLIILFYFRGRLNFIEKNKTLKALAVVWIVQNLLMVASTAHRNYEYIAAHGLTYKRTGVYVYLVLTVIGLLYTLVKLTQFKTNWYLVRKVSWCFFIVLTISPIVNWDRLVYNSQLNLSNDKEVSLDVDYLSKLSSECYPMLYEYAQDHDDQNLIHNLERKVGQYLVKRANRDWRSYTVRNGKLDRFIENRLPKTKQKKLVEEIIEESFMFQSMRY